MRLQMVHQLPFALKDSDSLAAIGKWEFAADLVSLHPQGRAEAYMQQQFCSTCSKESACSTQQFLLQIKLMHYMMTLSSNIWAV